jgi:hypothetical protein
MTLRLWPRIATSKNGPWRFIPDYENADLYDHEATKPETVAVRSLPVLGPVSGKQQDHGSDFHQNSELKLARRACQEGHSNA